MGNNEDNTKYSDDVDDTKYEDVKFNETEKDVCDDVRDNLDSSSENSESGYNSSEHSINNLDSEEEINGTEQVPMNAELNTETEVIFQIGSVSKEFARNNFNDVEDAQIPYEERINQGEKVSEDLKNWIKEMENKVDFVYDYQQAMAEEKEEPFSKMDNCTLGDPYVCFSDFQDQVLEVRNLTKDKVVSHPVGKCLVRLTDGTELTGSWRDGRREGQGSRLGGGLDVIDILMVSGYYRRGRLEGRGKIQTRKRDEMREGWFSCGKADGPFRGVIKGSGLAWLGWYRNGLPFGTCWQAVLGDAWLVGRVDRFGQFSGPDISFIYPDLNTALNGQFKDGHLANARSGKLTEIELEAGLMVPSFVKTSSEPYRYWPSTKEDISCPPHLPDPYEKGLVMVTSSSVPESGEGLVARVRLDENVIVSYYHGVRHSQKEVIWPKTGYSILLDWDIATITKREGEVLDILPQYQSSASYTSTLAHKVQHSFSPNCEWTHALHPCYGRIPAIRTLREISAGEELFIHYGMDMETAPQWYKDFWIKS